MANDDDVRIVSVRADKPGLGDIKTPIFKRDTRMQKARKVASGVGRGVGGFARGLGSVVKGTRGLLSKEHVQQFRSDLTGNNFVGRPGMRQMIPQERVNHRNTMKLQKIQLNNDLMILREQEKSMKKERARVQGEKVKRILGIRSHATPRAVPSRSSRQGLLAPSRNKSSPMKRILNANKKKKR